MIVLRPQISELYDSIKYDALHNQVFMETIFTPMSEHQSSTPDKAVSTLKPPAPLKELYEKAKILFDYIAPAEYGIEKEEKLEIGLLTSWPLLKQILDDLVAARDSEEGRGAFYFTKESHIQTLVNLVLLSDLPIVMPQLPELDYMVSTFRFSVGLSAKIRLLYHSRT
jgi:inositol hexakisphosphate/diphosphoinositol-pentakisphosphate kinase